MSREIIIYLVGCGAGLSCGIAFAFGALRGQERYYKEKFANCEVKE